MAYLLKNLTNSIWHAFYALQGDTPGIVAKSKLKVLTANFGTLMDLYGVEKGLDDYRSTQWLTFDQFLYYLQNEVFASISDATPMQTCRLLEERIEEICWLVSRKAYADQKHRVFEDRSIYQLFRIFCLLAEMGTHNAESSYLITMHSNEVAQISSQLVTSLGLHWDSSDFAELSAALTAFRFPTFLAVLESKYSGGGTLDTAAVAEAIDDLYQIYVNDVIKKGYLIKKGFLLPTMRYYWFVLQPGKLTYYKDAQQKDPAGVITLNVNCWADAVKDSGKLDKQFILSSPDNKALELVADDHRGRLQWLAALQIAIDHSGDRIGYQRSLAMQRRSMRLAKKQLKEETGMELQHERQARIAAELQARKLEALSREEGAKVQELEEIKLKLERLLEEEKQALQDEEIVRNLQARVLKEEWERREQLEKLQQEQQELLESERLKRLEFEQKQQENELKLQEAAARLEQLESERQGLDAELRSVREKVRQAEGAQILLEAQIVVTRPLRGGERIRRTQSMIPTSKERSDAIEYLKDRVTSTQEDIHPVT
ncbi:switch-associated protein 70-like [Neodiprion pinetum]|uniref:Switch-associated protein 70 n=1 Tax=Neodiprion lecontei TaxID=441921 RepID=A0A6J0CBH3_NEOLC|nr:switch-associated protein 70 [Neodiprion lecontei]XP_046428015.1 switch-associated protein 70-like [Neodiprion fabricii]XP_046484740.1 switch-associated protein 70-like [Neodiprion pinetum]XP_046621902.1 switch-associated protein 70-like [Neodiprion virginianus]